MVKVMKKATALALILALFVSAFAGLSLISAQKADAASYPTGYPNTYKNTGMGATDIIGVARTQIGYQENYYGTKYGYWYTPEFVDQPWCAMFVSWCANQAGITNSVIPRFAACSIGIAWFKSVNRWHDSAYYGGTYTPKKGDVVFYRDYGSTSLSTHVGLVAGLHGKYINAIEGNSTDSAVCEFTHNEARRIDSAYVIGYGNPRYSSELENEPTTYEMWQVTADGLNMRKTADTSAKLLTTLPFGATCKVKKFKQQGGYLWGYTTYNSKSGWIALDFCDYIYGNVNGQYYQHEPSVTPTSKTIYIGDSFRITAENGLGGKYTVSDTTKAKVSSLGKVTGLKAGTVTVTLTTNTGSASCKVKVKNPVLSDRTATACIGDSYTLSVSHAKSDVTWSSADKTIAKVSSKGKVTALSKGVVNITATVGEVKLKCEFTVTKTPKIYENYMVVKKTYLKDSYTNLKSLVQVPKQTVLKISEFYYSDTFTYGKTSYNGKEGWIIVNKCKYVNGTIGGIRYLIRPYITEKEKTLYLREKFNFEVLDADKPITYATLDKKVVKINDEGLVTGVGKGESAVTATIGKTVLTIKVKVNNPEFKDKEISLVKDKTKQLEIIGGSGKITWKSSDEKVATVDKNGLVTATGFGKATITATRNGVDITCTVKGFDPIFAVTQKTVRVNQTKKLRILQSTGGKITWKSSNTKLVKVNDKGQITGVARGNAYVTAKVDGKTLRCDIRIAKAA